MKLFRSRKRPVSREVTHCGGLRGEVGEVGGGGEFRMMGRDGGRRKKEGRGQRKKKKKKKEKRRRKERGRRKKRERISRILESRSVKTYRFIAGQNGVNRVPLISLEKSASTGQGDGKHPAKP